MLNRDFKTIEFKQRRRLGGTGAKFIHAVVLGTTLGFGFLALFGPTHDAEATRTMDLPEPTAATTAIPDSTLQLLTEELPIPPVAGDGKSAEAVLPPEPEAPWHTVTVRSGDTLSAIFDRLELPPRTWYKAINAKGPGERLQRLRPGQQFKVWVDGDKQLSTLHYVIDEANTLVVSNTGEGYVAKLDKRVIENRMTYAHAVIEDSLYAAGQKAGLSDNIIMQLVGIFGWDVDFALDIRGGDSFTVVYEEAFLDGEKLEDGKIVAAEFINRGKAFRALRYTDPKGNSDYFSSDGHSMRKAFLRSPVDFRRISSGFQRERWHPVLGRKRPHRGVDYAANVGTPIKASGDGKVIFRGWKGGYGRTVIIQHGGRISTLYAHMSSFRRGVYSGTRVKQGQVIGYVGQSGLATGPHLHYEFRVNGVHRNPLTVKLPKAEPIKKAYRADFEAKSQRLISQLDVLQKTIVTLNQH